MEKLTEELKRLVKDGIGDLSKMLMQDEKDQEKFAETIKQVCSCINETTVANFITSQLIPAVLTLENAKNRDILLKLTFDLIKKFPINLLNSTQIQNFRKQMKTNYVKYIEMIRKQHDSSWSKIWILLVRYLQEHLHSDVEFANALFSIVEAGFKTASDKMDAYDCWMELIKNYQMQNTFLKNPKHIKLLTTPLRLKIKTEDPIVYKRMQVWILLLKTLKENAIEVLHDFFNYCFSNDGKLLEGAAGKSLYKTCCLVWKEGTGVLLEIMGHKYLCKEGICWKSVEYNFDVAVVTTANFKSCYTLIINAVINCTVLLDKWADKSTQKMVAHCLWYTLSVLRKSLEGDDASNATKQIIEFLENYILSKRNRNQELSVAVISILEVKVTDASTVFANILMSQPQGYKEHLICLLEACHLNMKITEFFKLGFYILSEKSLNWDPNFFVKVWSLYYTAFSKTNLLKLLPNEGATFLLSYIYNSNNTKMLQYDKMWCDLFNKLQPSIMVEFTRFVKSDKEFNKYTVKTLSLLMQCCENNAEKFGKMKFSILLFIWTVLGDAVKTPISNIKNLKEMTAIVRKLLRVNIRKFSQEEQMQLLEMLSHCLLIMIRDNKAYILMDPLEELIKSLSDPIKVIISHILINDLTILSKCKQNNVAQKARKLCETLISKKPFHKDSLDLSRGAKLTTMVRHSLDALNKNNRCASQLNRSLPNLQEKTSREFPKIFGKTEKEKEEFVVIDTEYKFDKSKLSARQKELLKRRRDDIPSLYVDLSQNTQSESLSEDLFKINNTNEIENEESNSAAIHETKEKTQNKKKPSTNDSEKANQTKGITNKSIKETEQNNKAKIAKQLVLNACINSVSKKESPKVISTSEADNSTTVSEKTHPQEVIKMNKRKSRDHSNEEIECSNKRKKTNRLVLSEYVKSISKNNSPKVISTFEAASEKNHSQVFVGTDRRKSVYHDSGKIKQTNETDSNSKIEEKQQLVSNNSPKITIEKESLETISTSKTDNCKIIVEKDSPRTSKSAKVNLKKVSPETKDHFKNTFEMDADLEISERISEEVQNSFDEKNAAVKNNNSLSSKSRELNRLKIDACFTSITTESRTLNGRPIRNTRRLNKRNKETIPEQSKVNKDIVNNNNTQIVESSQESIISIKPLSEQPKKMVLETESCSIATDTENTITINTDNEKQTSVSNKEIIEATKDTESCNSYESFSVEIVIDVSKPVTPSITSSDMVAIEKDTESIEMDKNLPGSPITVETPTRTNELLLNTSDISPIRLNTSDTLLQRKSDHYVQEEMNKSPKITKATIASYGNRSKKIMDLANNQQIQTDTKFCVIDQQEESNAFLTFSRELPSSNAIPAGGSILKRKKPDFTDDNSPCVKRKRVNFPDPPTTSEKLIPNENAKDESTRKEVKCKKQLNMNQFETVIDEQFENKTDSDEVAIKPTDSKEKTVEDRSFESCLVEKFDDFIKVLSAADENNEDHLNLLLQLCERVENALPRRVLLKYLENRLFGK